MLRAPALPAVSTVEEAQQFYGTSMTKSALSQRKAMPCAN